MKNAIFCRIKAEKISYPHKFSKQEIFRNPVINADVPDMDMVRVGDNYYMISLTRQQSANKNKLLNKF